MSEPPIDRRALSQNLEHSVNDLAATVRELRAQLVSKELYENDQARAGERMVALSESQAARFAAIAEASRVTLELIGERIAAVKEAGKETLALVKQIEKQRADDRRLLITALVLPVLLLLLGAYLASQT